MAIYEITEDGKVFNLIKGKELKYHIDSNGYVFVNLRTSEGKQTKALVHRLVAEQFVNNPNNYTYVKHKDGNLQNNHYTNLEWMEMANANLRKHLAIIKETKPRNNVLYNYMLWKEHE